MTSSPLQPADFSRIVQTLYGANWHPAFAKAIGVDERNVRRWERGEAPIPNGIKAELVILCRRKATQLSDIADEIYEGDPPSLTRQGDGQARAIYDDNRWFKSNPTARFRFRDPIPFEFGSAIDPTPNRPHVIVVRSDVGEHERHRIEVGWRDPVPVTDEEIEALLDQHR